MDLSLWAHIPATKVSWGLIRDWGLGHYHLGLTGHTRLPPGQSRCVQQGRQVPGLPVVLMVSGHVPVSVSEGCLLGTSLLISTMETSVSYSRCY